jgi:hypothetical protein
MPSSDFSDERSATWRLQFDGGCHGDSMTANISHTVCSPTGEAAKTQKPVLCRVFPNCYYRKKSVAKDKISTIKRRIFQK